MELNEIVVKSLDKIEAKLAEFSTKAEIEAKFGTVSSDTKSAIDGLGTQQREIADRLLALEQAGVAKGAPEATDNSWGAQLIKAATFKDFVAGNSSKMRVEVKNTLVGSDTNVAPARASGIVGGAFQPLSMEAFLPSVTTTSNAIEFTKENAFTNNAA